MQSRPIQELNVLRFHLKVLGQQGFDFRYFQHLINLLIQLHDATVFVGAFVLTRSKQEPCVVLRTHGVRLLKRALRYCAPAHKYGMHQRSSPAHGIAVSLRILLAVCLVFSIAAAGAEGLDQRIFGEVDRVRAAAEKSDALLLSPRAYSRGVTEYDKARRSFEDGRSREQFAERLQRAEEYFQQAINNAQAARVTFGSALESRAAANMAEAYRLASQDWTMAEKQFSDAARTLEKGDHDAAQERGERADDLFRTAELNAIRARYLSEARSLIAEADQNKVEKRAPRTLTKARDLLDQADTALIANRYETIEVQALADLASYEARHSIYIASLGDQVKEKTLTVEDVILDWESPVIDIAAALGIEPDLTHGYSDASRQVVAAVHDLQQLPDELVERERQITGLEDEIRELDARLGGASAERVTLVRRLEKQARTREQFQLVENTFTAEEAQVLRDGEHLIVRLVGLGFASNSSKLSPDAIALLDRVEAVIDIFPRCNLTLEGHTDSRGNAQQNMVLSEARARSVMSHMTDNMRIPAFRITAVGYGDTHPIASNRSAEGRAQNRRIDLIIVPDTEDP